MKKEEFLKELYDDRVRKAMSEEYRKATTEINILSKKVREIDDFLKSDGSSLLTVKKFMEMNEDLEAFKKKLEIIKIERDVWNRARDICMEMADDVVKDGGKSV